MGSGEIIEGGGEKGAGEIREGGWRDYRRGLERL